MISLLSRMLSLPVALSLATVVYAAPAASVRVMIQFRAAVEGAAPELLARLQRRAGVPMSHVASVASSLHAYVLSCPPSDDHCAVAQRALRQDETIQDVLPDQLRKPLRASP